MRFLTRLLLLGTASGLMGMIAGCGLFGGDDDVLPPKKLIKFEATLPVKKIWSAKLGKGSEFLRVGLSPAGDGKRIYAASRNGVVSAFNPETGKRIWRVEVDVLLSAGPGTGENYVVVAGSDGDLICLAANDGREVWRININGESLARPLIRNDSVVVQTIDGKLQVFSVFDGKKLWSIEQSAPRLTLRGTSSPVIVGTTVVAGFDNGRLVGTSLSSGVTQWEAMLSPPSGRSDLDRLSDVDGSVVVVGQDIYAAGYQGKLAAVASESGRIIWARDISTHVGVAVDFANVYSIDESGEVIALLRRNGSEVWRQDALLRREPTSPVAFDNAVAIGDFEGYVHLFSNIDGRPVARIRVGKGLLSGAPVVIGGRLYVQSESGVLEAYAVRRPERKRDAPDIATGET
ncbi:MAG: outer membrane protein assembly factor BamB [Gammaproteobacteria bacterium]|nr:outer membrane protein assembly factor BamB [Pseudomonadota bacterium]TDJ13531.1 MAG: outer membrane protein assembly factor BamB [Gammaproteobacteria bacterium]